MKNSSKTLVSIIIPSFNEGNNIKNLTNRFANNLEISESKDYRSDVEIIIVNNGSTDNSKNILEILQNLI